jgi:hypothetical protein
MSGSSTFTLVDVLRDNGAAAAIRGAIRGAITELRAVGAGA